MEAVENKEIKHSKAKKRFKTVLIILIVLTILTLPIQLLLLTIFNTYIRTRLNNEYVKSKFEGWHYSEAKGFGNFYIPGDWNIIREGNEYKMVDGDKIMATGVLFYNSSYNAEKYEELGAIHGSSSAFESITGVNTSDCELISSEILESEFPFGTFQKDEKVYCEFTVMQSTCSDEAKGSELCILWVFDETCGLTPDEIKEICEAIGFHMLF